MARGWESKSVEEQINEREAQAETQRRIPINHKREGILLARSRTLNAMESSRDERYRALLKRTLDHLDSELAKLD